MKEHKTNAMRCLDKAGCSYLVHMYAHQENVAIEGQEVAKLLNQNPNQVFKTLVTQGTSNNYYVFVLPVCAELDLKKAARVVNEKAVELIAVKQLLSITGYVRGGCSPLAMKKSFPTWIDETAQLVETILFSGGRIGLQIEMNPKSLRELIHAEFSDLLKD